MNIKSISIVLLFLLAGLGAGYWLYAGEANHAPSTDVVQGDFDRYFSNTDADVILYSLEGCPFCASMVELLEQHDVRYEKRDLETSEAAMREARDLGATRVPLLLTRNHRLEGFDEDLTLEMLGKREQLLTL